jgi:hypothetical protein
MPSGSVGTGRQVTCSELPFQVPAGSTRNVLRKIERLAGKSRAATGIGHH